MHLLYTELLRAKGMTRAQVSRASGRPEATVSRVLAGVVSPSERTRDQLDAVLALGSEGELVYLLAAFDGAAVRGYLSDERGGPVAFASRDTADRTAELLAGPGSTLQVYACPARADYLDERWKVSGADAERLIDPPGDDWTAVAERIGRLVSVYAKHGTVVPA